MGVFTYRMHKLTSRQVVTHVACAIHSAIRALCCVLVLAGCGDPPEPTRTVVGLGLDLEHTRLVADDEISSVISVSSTINGQPAATSVVWVYVLPPAEPVPLNPPVTALGTMQSGDSCASDADTPGCRILLTDGSGVAQTEFRCDASLLSVEQPELQVDVVARDIHGNEARRRLSCERDHSRYVQLTDVSVTDPFLYPGGRTTVLVRAIDETGLPVIAPLVFSTSEPAFISPDGSTETVVWSNEDGFAEAMFFSPNNLSEGDFEVTVDFFELNARRFPPATITVHVESDTPQAATLEITALRPQLLADGNETSPIILHATKHGG
ncbi:MAG: hypothetical protein KC561_11150, partial [Myxococcales bacterium]|nr:hypothetical protein [Myxococcales bacterium]